MDKNAIFRQYVYYIIIAIISLISVFFLPLLGSDLTVGWNLPTTTVGWIVYVVTRIMTSIINVMVFHCFMQQAKINIKEDKRYLEAIAIYDSVNIKAAQKKAKNKPKSPQKWYAIQYGWKGTTIALGTAVTTVALTQALLTFDWVGMMTYLFTIAMGIIFGVLQMRSAEEYWTDEFWRFCKILEKEMDDAN